MILVDTFYSHTDKPYTNFIQLCFSSWLWPKQNLVASLRYGQGCPHQAGIVIFPILADKGIISHGIAKRW